MDKQGSEVSSPVAERVPFARPGWQGAAGYAVGILCLIWVLHDIRFGELWRNLSGIRWEWVALGILLDILSYVSQGWRWKLLLQPLGELSLIKTTQAIYVGLFTNEVLPMRFGEVVRAYLAARWIPSNLVAVLPSMAVERLLDGLWLAAGLGLAAMFVPLPKNLLRAGDAFGIAIIILAALFLWMVFRERKSLADHHARVYGWKPARLAVSFVDRMAEGIQSIGVSRCFYCALGVSLLFLAIQALSFWFIMLACGLRLSFWVGATVYLIVHLGTALPNAPANVGTYQFFTVAGLGLFGVDKTLATGFSVVVFLLLTLPLWAIGFFALSRSGTTLYAIRSEMAASGRMAARVPPGNSADFL